MGKRRKLNTTRNNHPIIEENTQFGEQQIQEENDIETYTSFDSSSESSSKGEKKTRGYTHMLDVWDMPDGEFILVEVDPLGNPMGWEGKTLLNAIGSLVRRHQCAPINYLSWKDMPEDYIVNMLELIQIFSTFLHSEYGGPGTLLVLPFVDMVDAINERGLPGGPQAAQVAFFIFF
ncbi:uncharacterized protein LOC114916958 [Cajanus cajan]|uniref:uncharacterized protein LOC114916958 n=1 Tax=Cajanus cajan TaxID=3821 RepID=UPI0010FBB7D6|nr:uncharacterized protein LOC114916958 [Cajanus cajan]